MRRQLELTPRLRLLADWVPQGAAFADIGTDHGCLPTHLVLEGRVRSCIASDLRPAPLRRARETARGWGAEADIQFRLCNGLAGIRPGEAEVIAIAGLGGENIAAILDRAPWTADGNHVLLLQPMTRAEVLRQYLADHGYAIRREALALDRGILYPVMEAGAGHMELTPGRAYGGAALRLDPLGDRYLIETILRLQNAVAGLNRSSRRNGAADDKRKHTSGNRGHTTDAKIGVENAQTQKFQQTRKCQENREKADRLRDILTELLVMREEWRYANRAGD